MISTFQAQALAHLQSMRTNSVEAIITDPPYDYEEAEKQELHKQFLRVARGSVIVFAPPENQWVVPTQQYLFWIKPISTKNTSRRYSRFVEMIHVYGEGKWKSERHWSQYPNVFTDSIESRLVHPCQKPLSLLERLVKNHTDSGDWVLDPFCGSGTTLIACARNSRSCIGVDSIIYLCRDRLIAEGISTQRE